ncbi:MAG TPA: glycosyltransferase family 4 protein [Anaerolineales bacterium]|nr:glycosyltransferase family 4 protein [Anaerolineales bacterium]
MRILCLLDYHHRYPEWLWAHLPQVNDQLDFVIVPPAPPLGYLGSAPIHLRHALRRLRQGAYDLVLAWELKNGLAYALYRRLFNRCQPPFIILSFAGRGLPAWLLRFALRSVDGLTVPSALEASFSARHYGFPASRVLACPNGIYDDAPRLQAAMPAPSEDYIFAGGYSKRDFKTLLQAVDGLDIPVKIIAPRRLLPSAALHHPPSTLHYSLPTPRPQYWQAMFAARLIVIPLQPAPYSAGLTDLQTAMSAARPVIVTNTGGLAEYIEHGQDGLLVPPGDPAALRQAILELWNDPAACHRLGAAARQRYETQYAYEAFAQRTYAAVRQLLSAANPL